MGFWNWFKSEPKSRAPNSGAHGDFRWATHDDLDDIDAFEKLGLPVGFLKGKQFYHPARRKPHGIVIGNTGTGKTTRIFAPLSLSDAASKMSIVCVDTVGDWSGICLPYRAKLGPSYRLDPCGLLDGLNLGSTKRAFYNPMADYLKVRDKLRFPGRAAKLTNVNVRSNDGRDRYFYQMAQRATQGSIMAQAVHAPKHANLPAVAKIFNRDFFGWVQWLLAEKEIDPFIRDLLHPFLPRPDGEFDRSIPECINTIAAEMRWLLNEAISDTLLTSDFSFAALSREVGTVTISAPLSMMDDGFDRWISLLLTCALSELQDSPGPVPVVFILDELKQYCSDTVAETIARIYATGRKYNLRVYVAVTSLSQLEVDCFPKGRHQDVLGNSGVIHILNVSDPQSSAFVKEMSGEKTAISVSRSSSSQTSFGPHGSSSSSSSRTVTPHGVPVIRTEEVRGIDDDCQVVLLDEVPYLIFAETKGYYDIPELRARAGENPFFKKKPEEAEEKKIERKPPVDEVAILLKEYGL